jgi:superfamily II DNA/RNA helicase
MRQTLLFSATMPPAIRRLAEAFLSNPKEITVAPPATPAETVTQGMIVVAHAGMGGLKEKRAALRRLIDGEDVRNALIFCNRKRDVGVVHRSLSRHGYDAGLLHGDLAQSQRTDVLDRFKTGDLRLLVCSDVAARGLDISDMSHVFNFDVPTSPEDYVHRIGRTGRAGRSGRAFTIAVPEDGKYVAQIEKLIGKPIPRVAVDAVETADLDEGERVSRKRRSRGRVTERNAARGRRRGRSEQGGQRLDRPAPADQTRKDQARSDRPPTGDMPARDARRRRRDERLSTGLEQTDAFDRPNRPDDRSDRAKRPLPGASRGRPPRDAEAPVVGMGDHVPAFLLRDVPLRKKA